MYARVAVGISSSNPVGRGEQKCMIAFFSGPYFTSLTTAVHGISSTGSILSPINAFVKEDLPFFYRPYDLDSQSVVFQYIL